MPVSDLTFAPRTSGRAAKAVRADYVRDLEDVDMGLLSLPRPSASPPTLVKIRERHHALARALARGITESECALMLGYDISRVSVLKNSPAFVDLVAHYRSAEDLAAADLTERMLGISHDILTEIENDLDDPEVKMSVGQKESLFKTFADRAGHAPVTKSVSINATVDLSERLSAARKRLESK